MSEIKRLNPFDLDNEAGYAEWKEQKLAGYPQSLGDLVVEIADPFALSLGEKEKILALGAKANMALYVTKPATGKESRHPHLAIIEQLGVKELDHHDGADSRGLSALSPGGSASDKTAAYIPYSKRAIGWHTDGYYHPWERQTRTLTLYCERPADEGGENRVWDHDIAYIRLRDENPEVIRALMVNGLMTIPARMDGENIARPNRSGPVFFVQADGRLQMRYTSRTISIRWRQDETSTAAVTALKTLFEKPDPLMFQGRLEAGWGLISSNVLHTREAFKDDSDDARRVLYRARYFDSLPAPS
ncbi:MAG: TauD/TfdA family dioxygenase [Magnetococcales bacterium]|nr:TauD/TfdA family dioxygenase [Magnetococcales bacterium]